jgi:hypothetical protein
VSAKDAMHTANHLADLFDIPLIVRRKTILLPEETGRVGNLALFTISLDDPERDGIAEAELTGAQLKAFTAGMQVALGRWPNRLHWDREAA